MANDSDEPVSLRTWIAVLGTMLGAFMAVMDIQITNSSLRDITGGIGATQDEGSWISTSYLIGEIVTIPLTAWLSRVFSTRWYLVFNVSAFLVFSALCGISKNLTEMILFRVGQGFTGGVMIPMAQTIAVTYLPKRLQAVGLALFGMTATLGPAVGPFIGGWLTDNFGWQMDFYVNFVPGALMLAAILYAIDRQPLRLELLRGGDYFGVATMAIGLGSLIAFLEEGQRQDWFTSSFIRDAAILAVIFIPLFLIAEFLSKQPFVNIRLLGQRTLGSACAVNFTLGLALYGSVYLLPQYLEQVESYSAYQTGAVMIWVGLPQLLIFPVVPVLMKRVDLRLMVCIGALVFAYSCFMNTHMSYLFAGPQFTVSSIVRALGQPFTIVPLASLATSRLSKDQQADGSALFNIGRNLGGSVGTAALDTLITQREQFHDSRIGEYVNVFSPQVQERISTYIAKFVHDGFDQSKATYQAYASLKALTRRDAYVLAYSEGFWVVGLALGVGAIMVWICQQGKAGQGGEA
jgi:DHA2 family multidrug resistance protein